MPKKIKSPIFLLFFSTFILEISINGQNQPISPLISSYKEHQQHKSATDFGLEWISLGPTLNSARVEAVQSDPLRPGTIYVAFGSGGLWKTVNNGMTWKSIFDNQPSLGIGDIALAPSDPNTIYLGTGESLKKARNFTMPGVGIYKSTDGGQKWEHMGLDDTWHIGEIAVHPEHPNVILVAALGHFWSTNIHRGMYRSEDGGKTWDHVLYIDENTGANDVVFSGADPNIVYATMWEHEPHLNGKKSGVYKSEDQGVTWQRISDGIHIDENTGRMGITASFQDADKAYVFVDQRNRGRDSGAGEVYRTLDGGQSWTKTHEGSLYSLSVIGWYFMDLYVNPSDDEEIYGLGVRLVHSTDGGESFDFIGGRVSHLTPSPAQTLHLDHCEMWINPLNPDELILGNDGGVYHSYDNGQSWLHLNNIPAGEFYDIELDHSDPYIIYGGTQDDATVFGTSREINLNFDDPWKYLWIDAWSGGDGCITLVDPNDSNTIYFSMQEGGARRMDLVADTSTSIRPRFPKEDNIKLDYNFISPYILSPHNSNRIYMGCNYMLQSNNRGEDWEIISPDLIDLSQRQNRGKAIGAIAESYFEEGVLYAGTDRGDLWITMDDGQHWENRSGDLPTNYIRCITPSRYQRGRVYIQLTGLNYDDLNAYLFVSEDYGKSWKSIKGNLPNQPVNVIVEDLKFENTLYAGTYRGLYISNDRGNSWSYLGSELPDVSIADIVIEKKSNDMVIATHGRGIYKVNLSPLYEYLKGDIQSTFLFEPITTSSPGLRDTHNEVDEITISKTPITFWLKKEQEIRLEVHTLTDSLIWNIPLDGKKGFNQYRWDLKISEENSDQPYFIHYKKYLQPGEYQLKLKSEDGVLTRRLEVRRFEKN